MQGRSTRAIWLLAGALTLLGCGSDDPEGTESAGPASEAQPATLGDPLAQIPRDRLYGASAAENLWSPRIELEVLNLPAGWDGASLAIVSDLHLGSWAEDEAVARAAVQRAMEANTDLIALLGDYVEDASQIPTLSDILSPLRGRRAVAVLGDRDVRSDSLEAQVVRALEGAGVVVLRNETVTLDIGGDTASIAGLDPGLRDLGIGDQNFIVASLGQGGSTPLLLTHIPGFAARAPAGAYPIIVAGNTFCGDVEVPGTPRMSFVRDELFPGGEIEGTERLFRVRGQTVLITCGLGFGFVPVRFGAAPEVPILTLRRLGPPVQRQSTEQTAGDSIIQQMERDTL